MGTGVPQSAATVKDMQLYFYCKGKAASKCTGIQAPCTCSNPPCLCPGDEPSTTSTTPSTTTPTTGATTSTTTSATTTTTTQADGQLCALRDCGCDLSSGAGWCDASNMWVASDWCQSQPGNCQNCNGVWCGSNPSSRRLLKQY